MRHVVSERRDLHGLVDCTSITGGGLPALSIIVPSRELRRFQVRLAIVCTPGPVSFSSRFREVLSDDLRVVETRDAARG